ncbi:hypothetical protein S40285_02297 [Stachybotrys chlorohalonatus IBT 40285]|uniref:Uncharacterized protein n=1 Tax=Stachybotrys chlorohalonatus (strain IBT 40285) TaxID=1283841 RepID=A0A084QSC5_STAC4|nr:hypothetical protein S40285_02297 [Stachybotrys chlorohalonata IBT 40285]
MDLPSQLRSSILAASLPAPSATFVASLVQSRNPPLPLPSLLATARSRILACDLSSNALLDTVSLAALPANLSNAAIKEVRLPLDVHVQVLDVENLGVSRWDQIEEIEAIERGERTRGREIVRIIDDDNGQEGVSQTQQQRAPAADAARSAGKAATHRLVLQDCRGQKVFALELHRIDKIGVGRTMIGEKILVKAGAVVARGTVLLTPDNCVLLGGKIDAWQKSWVDGRLTRLKEALSTTRGA